ncbi:hypothetical protein E2C01_049055 [Portunus trituberculatus]|uniref:Uncharacterized protein n=1 Tax=Portunus trituberculatus TaxID=210409 RepID=A0A5B7GF09_PORTR|nr:hypothetical protein [Portunus trituberculatus]
MMHAQLTQPARGRRGHQEHLKQSCLALLQVRQTSGTSQHHTHVPLRSTRHPYTGFPNLGFFREVFQADTAALNNEARVSLTPRAA